MSVDQTRRALKALDRENDITNYGHIFKTCSPATQRRVL
jgi:hypothetical protein